MTEGFANILGKMIFYRIINPHLMQDDKPVLVFLHEGLGSVAQWKGFPEALSQRLGYTALLYDRLRYGRSDALDKPIDSDYLPKEAFVYLPNLLQVLEIKAKLLLVGHSDGGTIALLFASRFPDQTLAVISEADHVVCENITQEGIRKAVQAWEKGTLKESLQKYHGQKAARLFYGWSGFLLSEEGKQWNIVNSLQDIQAPVLAIQGENDQYGSEKQLLIKQQHISGPMEILLLDNCGHIPHFEQKDIVLQAIQRFIKQNVMHNRIP